MSKRAVVPPKYSYCIQLTYV